MAKPSRKLSSKRKTRRSAALRRFRLSQSAKSAGKRVPDTEQQIAPSKQDKIIAMLSSASGATIPAIMQQTGWQQHSVRGFFAGVVRKKMELRLVSEKVDGQRIYRIEGGDVTRTSSKRASS